MKVYLVIGYHNRYVLSQSDVSDYVTIFGTFSTKEKAKEIQLALENNFAEVGETIEIEVADLELDKPTKEYDFFMTN